MKKTKRKLLFPCFISARHCFLFTLKGKHVLRFAHETRLSVFVIVAYTCREV